MMSLLRDSPTLSLSTILIFLQCLQELAMLQHHFLHPIVVETMVGLLKRIPNQADFRYDRG